MLVFEIEADVRPDLAAQIQDVPAAGSLAPRCDNELPPLEFVVDRAVEAFELETFARDLDVCGARGCRGDSRVKAVGVELIQLLGDRLGRSLAGFGGLSRVDGLRRFAAPRGARSAADEQGGGGDDAQGGESLHDVTSPAVLMVGSTSNGM